MYVKYFMDCSILYRPFDATNGLICNFENLEINKLQIQDVSFEYVSLNADMRATTRKPGLSRKF